MPTLRTALLASVLAAAPLTAGAETAREIASLKFLGSATVPNDLIVDGTLVGGISGLDYAPSTGTWYALSDDKSDHGPARFYSLKLDYGAAGFAGVTFTHAVTLLQADGQPYPNAKAGGEVPDPEAIRVDPRTGDLWWTSEGDRKLGLPPFLRVAGTDGRHIAALPNLPLFAMNKDKEAGPRHNNAFEGLSFAPDGGSVWVAMESALYEDGPPAAVDAGTLIRMTRLDRSGRILSQAAYPLDPIQARPTGKNGDNGLTEILQIGEDHLLAVERSGVESADGTWTSYIRLYDVDLTEATDVAGLASLKGADVKPAAKRLVLDLSKEPAIGPVDNIEAVSFGPDLSNEHRSLVLASDNNFNETQVNQFLVFEVVP